MVKKNKHSQKKNVCQRMPSKRQSQWAGPHIKKTDQIKEQNKTNRTCIGYEAKTVMQK